MIYLCILVDLTANGCDFEGNIFPRVKGILLEIFNGVVDSNFYREELTKCNFLLFFLHFFSFESNLFVLSFKSLAHVTCWNNFGSELCEYVLSVVKFYLSQLAEELNSVDDNVRFLYCIHESCQKYKSVSHSICSSLVELVREIILFLFF